MWIQWDFISTKLLKTYIFNPFCPIFTHLEAQMGPNLGHWIWATGAPILRTSKYSFNEHIKQDQCDSSGNFLKKIVENMDFDFFGDQNDQEIWPYGAFYFYTPKKVATRSLKIKPNWNPVEYYYKKCWKHRLWPIMAKFGAKNGPPNCPRSHFSHTIKYQHSACKPNFSIPY